MTNSVWIVEQQGLKGEPWFVLHMCEGRAEARAWKKANEHLFYALRVAQFVRAGK